MNFSYDQNDVYWLQKIRHFLIEQDVNNEFAVDASEKFPWHVRQNAGRAGLIGLDVSIEGGGHNLNALTMGLIYEEMGRCSVNCRELFGAGHGLMIDQFGSKYQKERYLPDLLKGDILVGVGLTERDTGSDLSSTKTFARRVENGYVLQGRKEWVSRVEEAGVFVVFAKTNLNPGVNDLTAFLVDMDDPKISKYAYSPMGLKGWSYGGFELNGVFVPEENRLGAVGQAFEIFNHHFGYWRILMALICIGSAKEAIDQAIAYSKERNVFGGPLARFHSVMHKVSESLTELDAAKLLCYRALNMLDLGQPCIREVAMAKWYGTEVAHRAIDHAIQIHGARGYCREYGLEQRLRDTRGLVIADGSNEVMKSLIGRETFGRSIYDSMYGREKRQEEDLPAAATFI
ncbi:acyl-CoA dehydrogenase family protein [Tumebacillus lipolyticus]|uniref:Acyl-CoA dehydrogenase family protein n=1 Tax=Tumebacillus lipolyticus TaxID=1280370 RepID=A0ABW4ZYX6_9BACL